MKPQRIIRLGFLVLAFALIGSAERQNIQISITAGTPIRLATQKTMVARLFIQSRAGNTGIAYVMLGVPTTATCDATNAAHLTAELGPGDATHPGSSFSDPQGANGMTPADAEDLAKACVDGSHSADKLVISYWKIN